MNPLVETQSLEQSKVVPDIADGSVFQSPFVVGENALLYVSLRGSDGGFLEDSVASSTTEFEQTVQSFLSCEIVRT